MRKFIKILLAVLCIFVLSGCGEKHQESEVLNPQTVIAEKTEPHKEEVTKVKEEPKAEIPKEEIKEEQKETVPEIPEEDNSLYCTLSVRCDEVLSNMDMLKEGKEEIIPQSGVMYPEQKVTFSEGESAFDVLKRELMEKGIHLEFVKTPGLDSMYIEGIGNLYEFDCGAYSGWLYKINDEKMTYGCSEYILENGDMVEFLYTCNFLKNN